MHSPAVLVSPQVFLDGIADKVRGAIGIVCGHVYLAPFLLFLSVVVFFTVLTNVFESRASLPMSA